MDMGYGGIGRDAGAITAKAVNPSPMPVFERTVRLDIRLKRKLLLSKMRARWA
jgi:hypothetical protein